MAFTEQAAAQDEYRVMLVLPLSRMVLAERHGRVLRMPRISIPKWTRRAKQLTEALKERWKVDSIVVDFLPCEQREPACAVIEVRTHDWAFSLDGLVSVKVDELDEQELMATERIIVRGILAGDTMVRGPFSRLGWIEEAQEWIRASLPDREIEFNGDVRRFNANGFFTLVRLGTVKPPAYWLKATGSPNEHEFAITTTLAQCLPNYLPPLVATRADWNAWVTEDSGQPLSDTFSRHSFEQAVISLAELQKASIKHMELMLANGCFDQRMPILRAHLPELFQYLQEAMSRQTSTKALPLETKRLRELERLLEQTCARIEAIGIPDTLIHNDMNAGNILYNGDRVVFTDWAEAYVGNPFLTFQHLRVQAKNEDPSGTWAPHLTAIYKNHWCTLLSESQVTRALALSPPLAIASYLLGRDMGFASPCRAECSVQSYARSLARHMDRGAQTPEFMEALCH